MTDDDLPEEEIESRRFWRRVRIFVLYPVLMLLLVVALTVAWLSARNAAARKKSDELIAQIRAKNLPIDNPSFAGLPRSAHQNQGSIGVAQCADDGRFSRVQQSCKSVYPWKEPQRAIRGYGSRRSTSGSGFPRTLERTAHSCTTVGSSRHSASHALEH